MPNRFAGKAAFITGGATGFGRVFAQALNAEGAAVAVADIDLDAGKRTAAELNKPDSPVVAVGCDVSDRTSVETAVRDVADQFGGIDILINNAARHLKRYNQPFCSLNPEEIRGLFDVNVLGVVNCSVACRDAMRQRGGGVIVNMSSIGGFMANNAYAVTKLAVRGLTIAFATELAADGIRVNAIAPGLMATESTLSEFSDEEFEEIAAQQLIPRRGAMDDVAQAMIFLCSEDAAFVTGETVRVAGGFSLAI